MTGQSLNYYWLYHLRAALLSRITGLGLYQVFAWVNAHALLLLILAGYRLAGRFTASVFGRPSGAWLLFRVIL